MMEETPTVSDRDAAPGRATRLADVLIIGAAKSGTTALFDYLSGHRQICASRVPEPEFFADDGRFARGMGWYADLFSHAEPGQLCVEASTAYTRWPEVSSPPARIARALPNARFIYLMREPVARSYSHYVHRVTKDLYKGLPVPVTFEEHIQREPMCLNSSLYIDQIERYLAYFGRRRFLFLLQDELRADPGAVLSRVCRFLEIDDCGAALALRDTSMHEGRSMIAGRVRAQMMGPIKAMPGVCQAAKLMPGVVRERLARVILSTGKARQIERALTPEPMKPETRRELARFFRCPNARLARFLGVDLSHWDI